MDQATFCVALYATVVACTLSSVLLLVWRAVKHDTTERFALWGGAAGRVALAGTIGTAEAGLLGFEPVALIPAAVLGILGFAAGAATSAVGTVLSALRQSRGQGA